MGIHDRDWYVKRKPLRFSQPGFLERDDWRARDVAIPVFAVLFALLAIIYVTRTHFPHLLGANSGLRPIIPMKVVPGGDIVSSRSKDGHYYLQGRINGVPSDFMVDTGATRVAISADLAASANITQCRPSRVNTANGVDYQACDAEIADLRIGDFQFQNVRVSISPNMSKIPLLGMNVLDKFEITQKQGQMNFHFQR